MFLLQYLTPTNSSPTHGGGSFCCWTDDMEQTVLTLHSDQYSWPWYVPGPVREITLWVFVTSFLNSFTLTFSPYNPLLYQASTMVVISTYSHFQGPGPTSDPFHISLLTSPSSHKLVILYINISLYLYCPTFFLDLYTLMIKMKWSFKCQKPVTEWDSVISQKRILIHIAIKLTTNITKRWTQRCTQGLYHCNSCYCSLKYHCTTHTQLKQTVPTTNRISTNIWQLKNRTVTVIWER